MSNTKSMTQSTGDSSCVTTSSKLRYKFRYSATYPTYQALCDIAFACGIAITRRHDESLEHFADRLFDLIDEKIMHLCMGLKAIPHLNLDDEDGEGVS